MTQLFPPICPPYLSFSMPCHPTPVFSSYDPQRRRLHAVTPPKKFVGPCSIKVPLKKPRHPKKHLEGMNNVEWAIDVVWRVVLLRDLRAREARAKEIKARWRGRRCRGLQNYTSHALLLSNVWGSQGSVSPSSPAIFQDGQGHTPCQDSHHRPHLMTTPTETRSTDSTRTPFLSRDIVISRRFLGRGT
jgi:hypothetical protein